MELEAPAWNQVVTPTEDPALLAPAAVPPAPPLWEAVGEMSSTAFGNVEKRKGEKRDGNIYSL